MTLKQKINIKEEYKKCFGDPVYFIENYLQTFDQTQDGYVPFILFEPQKRALRDFKDPKKKFNIVVKYRQCIDKDSLINTTTGLKKIKDLKIGEKIYSYNFKINKIEEDIIDDVVNTGIQEGFKIITNRNSFKTSSEHLFFSKTFKLWKKAKDIIIGEELLSDGVLTVVLNKISIKKIHTYDIKTRKNENFLLDSIVTHNSGITTLISAFVVWLLTFADDNKPESILIVANKLKLAKNVLKKIIEFYQQLPSWMIPYEDSKNIPKYINKTTDFINLPNKSIVSAVATSEDAARGFTPTLLIIDEAAHLEIGSEFWTAASPALATGGRAILNSTPNGQDELYYKLINESKKGKNNFNIINLKWYEDPRYNKNLKWLKDTEELIETDSSKWDILEKDGWKPTSPWYELQCENLYNDERKINQELNGKFNGSGDNVYEDEVMSFYENEILKEPIRKEYSDNNFWIWKDPVPNHRYVMSIDVSRGDSEDSSSIQIIDFEEQEQVAEFKGKVPPEILGEIAFVYGSRYNGAYCVVDLTGGYGETVVSILKKMKYKNMFYHKFLTNPNYIPTDIDVPGLNLTAYRLLVIDASQRFFRSKVFKIYSVRLLEEMREYTYKNGRPDHTRTGHDDLIIAIAMGIYIMETFFNKLISLESQTKTMLDNWILVDSRIPENITSNRDVNNDMYYGYKDVPLSDFDKWFFL